MAGARFGIEQPVPRRKYDTNPTVVAPEKWARYFYLLSIGTPRQTAAKEAGISVNTVGRLHADPRSSSGWEFYKQWLADNIGDVVPRNKLPTLAKRAHGDFEYFRKRYFGHVSKPWHIEAGNKIVELLETSRKEFLVINCPPGSGKSTLLTHDIVAWATVRNRMLRTMIGTGAESTGSDYLRRLKGSFERIIPLQADSNEVALGLACDAASTLTADFGRFRPEGKDYWSSDRLVVAQQGGVPAHQKEASIAVYGRRSTFLGGRYNLVVWDDVVTDQNSRTPSMQEDLARWWRSTAESRLEPGGLLVLMGQRMGAHDLYRHALDLRDITATLDLAEDDIDMEKVPRRYQHVVFKAHYDEKCQGPAASADWHKPETAKPWPEGCLLDPVRLTYVDLMAAKFNDAKNYACVYQQEDTDPGSVLVDPLWINGGASAKGAMFPGCWDPERQVGQFPPDLAGDCYTVATADPSMSNYWGLQLWVYQVQNGYQHLVDLHRKRMTAPDLLEWNHARGVFTGVLEDWFQSSKDAGKPLTHVIVETNAAQRFLLQYDHATRWSRERGVQLISHHTGSHNKADPKLGVGSLGPEYRHGRVRLPGHVLTRSQILPLYNEVTRYPDSGTTDQVMAHWFLRWGAEQHFIAKNPEPYRLDRPSWLRGVVRGMAS